MVSVIHNQALTFPDDFWKNHAERYWNYRIMMDEAKTFDETAGTTECQVSEEEKNAFMEKIKDLVYGDGAK